MITKKSGTKLVTLKYTTGLGMVLPVSQVLSRWRQEGGGFKAGLGSIVRPCLKINIMMMLVIKT